MSSQTCETELSLLPKHGISHRRAWRTGFWRRAPKRAFSALILAGFSAIGAVLVLICSDGKAIDHWTIHGHKIQPTVLLSLFSALGNALLRYAFVEGAAVAWWVSAQRGTNLESLNRIWESVNSTLPFFTSGRHVTRTASASFFVLLLLAVGPVLQRASTVDVVHRQVKTNLTVHVSPNPFPWGITGYYGNVDDDEAIRYYSPLFLQVLREYNQRTPIYFPDDGTCNGNCRFEFIAAGWDIECHNWSSPYRLISNEEVDQYTHAVSNGPFLDMGLPLPRRGLNTTKYNGPAPSQTVFWSNVSFENAYQDWSNLQRNCTTKSRYSCQSSYPYAWDTILLSSMVKSTKGRSGTLAWRYCALQEAVQRYPVALANSTLTILPMSMSQDYTIYRFERYADYQGESLSPTTVGGFALALRLQHSGRASLGLASPNQTGLLTTGSSPLLYLRAEDPEREWRNDKYQMTWSDPIDDMTAMLRELSLRMAIATSRNTTVLPHQWTPDGKTRYKGSIEWANGTQVHRQTSQVVVATMSYEEAIYRSHLQWLAAALSITALACMAILLTFKGWRGLGRRVGMSPLETAKAFDAPLLRQVDPNGTDRDIVDAVGKDTVQYGAVSTGTGSSPLMQQCSPHLVCSARLDKEDDVGSIRLRRRLRIEREGPVERPGEGETF